MNTQHRSVFALSGQTIACLNYCQSLIDGHNLKLISHIKYNNTPNIPYNKVSTQLGQESTCVIFDATENFDANALGIISGTIKGGGLLILLLPPAGYDHPNPVFLKRLYRLLKQHNITVIDVTNPEVAQRRLTLDSCESDTSNEMKQPQAITLSDEQENAVAAIIKVAKGHRKRPLVLTADRGRGKSTALGVAAKKLIRSGLNRIIVCAPAKAMVHPLLRQTEGLDGVVYFAPDQLDREHPEADLVLIDEAGAIPVPLLTRLLQHYSRIVFSTTLQGYEGNGKGFAIRFQNKLQTITPNWRSLRLEAPIRWGVGDPLEAFLNDLLLLNAEAVTLQATDKLAFDQLKYQRIDAQNLANDEDLLRQLFGLLIIAHYQTRPSDLLQLLDNPELSIHILSVEKSVIAAAIISHEGGLDAEMSELIYQGIRRPKGNLVPQILTFQLGMPKAATLTTDRIMRIAVHPDYQRNRLGSQLLSHIKKHSSADYLSSSFGLHVDLLHFWNASDYHIAYLGLKREASSGYHSAIMLCPLTPEAEILRQESQGAFKRHFCAQLADILKFYEAALVLALLSNDLPKSGSELTVQELRDINRFADGICGYDLVMSALLRYLPDALADYSSRLCQKDAELLVLRVLQHHDWSYCCKVLNLSGKQQALKRMQQSVAKLLRPVAEQEP